MLLVGRYQSSVTVHLCIEGINATGMLLLLFPQGLVVKNNSIDLHVMFSIPIQLMRITLGIIWLFL